MGDAKPFFCVHGHFYQPPRENPFTGFYRDEREAAPYPNWNARITAESYHPIAEAGNFNRISFNLGGTLARWMDRHDGATYGRIVNDVRAYHQQHGVVNALAQSVHHTILPLARGRDKRCQIRWGIASFAARFGHQPDGLWLPEMAVDYETLNVVADSGLRFVVLSDEQVRGDLSNGSGPYKVRLEDDRYITVFVRDRGLSNAFAFNMPSAKQARAWINSTLHWRKPGALTLLATDGETFGHHHKHGVEVLTALTTPSPQDVYVITTLGDYLRQHPPTIEVEIVENSAWSCSHSLGRWATGCSCTSGCGYWKGALRRALDNLAHDTDEIFATAVRARDLAPWALRDAYVEVVLGQTDGPKFLAQHHLGHLPTVIQQQLLCLLEAQLHRQRMYTSCAFFFEDLERLEPRYAISNAVQALALVRYATGDDLTPSFRRDLSIAVSPSTGRNGAQIFQDILESAQMGESPLGGSMRASRPMDEG